MKRQSKCRFINLAEQLTLQNDLVSQTMDSLLQQVSKDADVAERTDYEQIKKMNQDGQELNSLNHAGSPTQRTALRPKITQRTGIQPTVPQD